MVLVQTTFGKESVQSFMKPYMEPSALYIFEVYSKATTVAQFFVLCMWF